MLKEHACKQKKACAARILSRTACLSQLVMVPAFVIQGNAWPDCSGQDTVYLECILRKVHGDNSCWPQVLCACLKACSVYICGSCMSLLGTFNTWGLSMYRCKCYAATHFAARELCGRPQQLLSRSLTTHHQYLVVIYNSLHGIHYWFVHLVFVFRPLV